MFMWKGSMVILNILKKWHLQKKLFWILLTILSEGQNIIFYLVPRPGACLAWRAQITLKVLGARTCLMDARLLSWKSMLDNRAKADIVNVKTVMDAYAQRRERESTLHKKASGE